MPAVSKWLQKLAVFLFCFPYISISQSYNFKNYSVENGLPFIQISAIFQDSRGNLWSGGYGGLSQFNGFNFTNFGPRHGLANHLVTSITEDTKHNLWVGTIDGLSEYHQNIFKTYTVKNGLSSNLINCLYINKQGKLLVGTDKGICEFIGDRFKKIQPNLNKAITCIINDDKNNLFFGTTNGLYKLNGSTLDSLNLNGTFNLQINTLKADRNGKIWAGTNKGLICFDTNFGNLLNYHISDGLIEENVICLEIDHANNIWIGSQMGLLKFDGSRFFPFKIAQENNTNNILCLKTDLEQNLWIGTYAGLFKFRDEAFINFNSADGLLDPWIYAIQGDFKNNMWIGTRGGLFKYFKGKFSKLSRRNGLLSDTIYSIIQDKEDLLWIGMYGGLCAIQRDKLIPIPELNKFNCNMIFKAKNGEIWVGYDNGIACINVDYSDLKVKVKHYSLPANGLTYKVWGITEDKMGNIWIGSYLGGLFKFDGLKFTYMNDFFNLRSKDIVSLQYNPTNNHLYTSSFEGVYDINLSSNKVIYFNEESGLSSNLVYVIYLTNNGNTLWTGTNQGVNKINLWQYYSKGTKEIIAYGKADGFTGVESNTNGAFEDQEGNIWFGTVNGLIKYNPKKTNENLNETKLNINNIRLFYKDTFLTDGAILEPELNNISFHYNAICLTNPDKIRYIHKLEGFEESWSPESKEDFTTYSNLPPGKYTFKIRSCNNSGIWNIDPVVFTFVINTPYWQKWWFILIVILFIICLITLIFRIRVNQIKKTQKKEALNQIAISKNELKALRAQMNPHFMFNSLNSIQHYIISNNDEEAIFYLNKFARLMRMILSNSEKPFITIREEINSLKLYLELEEMRFQNKFKYEFIIDPKIDTDYEHIPTMLIQPYVENAILHGLTPKKEVGKLTIEINYEDKYIVCSIIDDGVGRNYSSETKINRPKEHRSMGMKITQDRLKLLNQINQSNLSMKITDLKNMQGLAIGTKVDIFIPIS